MIRTQQWTTTAAATTNTSLNSQFFVQCWWIFPLVNEASKTREPFSVHFSWRGILNGSPWTERSSCSAIMTLPTQTMHLQKGKTRTELPYYDLWLMSLIFLMDGKGDFRPFPICRVLRKYHTTETRFYIWLFRLPGIWNETWIIRRQLVGFPLRNKGEHRDLFIWTWWVW